MDDNNKNLVSADNANEDLMSVLVKLQKKQLFYNRVIAALLLIFVIALLCLLPSLFKTLKTAETTLTNANEAILQATDAIEQAKTTLEDVSKFATDGSAGLSESLEKIQAIDIESLNKDIENLGAVVEPMAKFFNVFK